MRSRYRGWILSDAVMAIGIIMVLGGIVATEMAWRAKAAQHLDNIRIATDEAELALTEMQQGHAPTDSSDSLRVERLTSTHQVANWQWVRVTARHGGQSATLIGLVRADATGGK
jgi:hypothetical protein